MFGRENFMITVKCGSDKTIMNEIIGVIDMLIGRQYGKTIGRIVDDDKPDLKVIIVRTSYRTFYMIREILEAQYPDVCGFKHV